MNDAMKAFWISNCLWREIIHFYEVYLEKIAGIDLRYSTRELKSNYSPKIIR